MTSKAEKYILKGYAYYMLKSPLSVCGAKAEHENWGPDMLNTLCSLSEFSIGIGENTDRFPGHFEYTVRGHKV